jgi:transposase-like protein
MTDSRPADVLLNYLRSYNLTLNQDYVRAALRTVMQSLMELEVGALTGAERHERKNQRQTYRNGYRRRSWETSNGVISIDIPKLRKGTYYPGFIASPEQTEQILRDLVTDAYVGGVEMDAIKTAVGQLGLPPVHSSQLSAISEQLDDLTREFKQRPLDDIYRELHLDLLDVRVERGGREVDRLLAVGLGEKEDGSHELLAHEIVPAINDCFWPDFLDDLRRRGVRSVDCVTSYADYRIHFAVQEVMANAVWQPVNALSLHGITQEIRLLSEFEYEFNWPLMRAA